MSAMEMPFDQLPSGGEIARYFLRHLSAKPQGSEGFDLYRDGEDYCYIWKVAELDLDLSCAYLLEVRTNTNGVETRDCLYVRHNPMDELGSLICEWYQKPVAFFDGYTNEWVRGAFRWFAVRATSLLD